MNAASTARLLLRIVAGLALLAGTVWLVGPRKLLDAVTRVDAQVLASALALSICSNVASAHRWAMIARALGLNAPGNRLVPMYARGITSNILLPGATLSGDMLRAYELSRLDNPLLESSVSVAFDRFSGLWTLCVLSFAASSAAWLAGFTLATGAHGREVLATYGVLLAAIVAGPFVPWPAGILRHLPIKAGARLADLWDRFRDPSTGLRRRLARSLGPSLLVQILSASALACCARSLDVQVPWLLLVAAAAPIFVTAALPVGVAGFGTRELAAAAVLGAAGVATDQAVATGLLYGVLGVIQGVLSAPLFLVRR